MKLIFLLLLVNSPLYIFSISSKLLGELPIYESRSFKPNGQPTYCAYYLKTDDFPYDNNLYIKVTLNYGQFDSGYMYYGGSNEKFLDGSGITLYDSVFYSSSSGGSYTFSVPKTTYKYLYISPPPTRNADSITEMTVESIYDPGTTGYKVLGKITKYGEQKFYPYDDGKYCTYYIKLDDFSKDDKIYFKAKLTYGSFESGYMHYAGYNTLFSNGKKIPLPNSVYRDSYSSSSISGGLLYRDYTYFFIINKPSYNYLYIAPPPTSNYDRILSWVVVTNTNRFGISVWVWIGIGIFVLVVIILSIVIYRCKKAQRQKNIDPTVVEPLGLNAVPNTYNPNANAYAPSPVPYNPNPYPYPQQPSTYY